MQMQLIKFSENLIIPNRAHYNDAGLDCYALDDVILPGLKTDGIKASTVPVKIPLGFGIVIPDGYVVTIRPRSSMNAKGIITQIGTIDSGYRGEICAILINTKEDDYIIKKGDKICQLIVEPVTYVDLREDLNDDRGSGGFGSTGR